MFSYKNWAKIKRDVLTWVQTMIKRLTCDNGKADLRMIQNKISISKYVLLSFLVRWFQYLCMSHFTTLLNWAERTDSEKGRWKFLGWKFLGWKLGWKFLRWRFLGRIRFLGRGVLDRNCKKKKCSTWNISCCWRWPRTEEVKCRVWSSWSKSGKPYN